MVTERPVGRQAFEGSARAIGDVPPAEVERALCGDGLWLDVGACTVRVQSTATGFAEQLHAAYGAFDFIDCGRWADLHVEIRAGRGLRRWVRPQVELVCDGRRPFEPFPASHALPLFEWGCNWLIAQRLNHLLLFHAGALERDGRALILPAMPGSGKSTLTAALSQCGWRLMSDEFGALDPSTGRMHAMLKPVALKNASISVIRAFAPSARFGPSFEGTRKGTVAHVAATPDAVRRRAEPAVPALVVLPKWHAGQAMRLESVPTHMVHSALAFNAFNYSVLGASGFRAVVALARRCSGWHLSYSHLDEALAAIERLWSQTSRTMLSNAADKVAHHEAEVRSPEAM